MNQLSIVSIFFSWICGVSKNFGIQLISSKRENLIKFAFFGVDLRDAFQLFLNAATNYCQLLCSILSKLMVLSASAATLWKQHFVVGTNKGSS